MENGDQKFIELLNQHLKPVYNFVYRIVRNKEDAEDISQDTFFKVWKNLQKYDARESFKTWLFAIARNTAIDHLRKKKSFVFSDLAGEEDDSRFEESIADPSPIPDEIFAMAEKKKMLEEMLSKISPIYRQVLLLRYQNGLTFEEIGKVLKKTLNTVKSQHRRGLSLLKKLLTDAPK